MRPVVPLMEPMSRRRTIGSTRKDLPPLPPADEECDHQVGARQALVPWSRSGDRAHAHQLALSVTPSTSARASWPSRTARRWG